MGAGFVMVSLPVLRPGFGGGGARFSKALSLQRPQRRTGASPLSAELHSGCWWGLVAATASAATTLRRCSRGVPGASAVRGRVVPGRRGLWPIVAHALCLLVASPRHSLAAESAVDEVTSVIDGDTVKLAKFGRCRLIGVNTPETVSPKQKEGAPPDCYGPEASALTKQLVPPGTQVRVELDAGPTDRYGRELVYLYRVQDNMFVNAELMKQGVARHMKVAPNTRYDNLFVQLEQEAAAAGRGLWKACPRKAAGAPDTGVSATAVLVEAGPGDSKNCKDFASYQEAKAWFDTYFPLYGDVAKLDGDGDGQPCEGLLRREKGK